MRVEEIENPGEEWDEAVAALPHFGLGHASSWCHILRDAYGIRSHYLALRNDEGEICGALPLAEFKTLRGRRELISMPFLDSAGVIARDEASEELLVDAAFALAKRVGAVDLEFRQEAPLRCRETGESVPRVDLRLALAEDEESQWKAVGAKVRNQTRKAEREGLLLPPDSVDGLGAFYEPFCVNMRDLGSPVHSRAFFAAAAQHFGERLRFVIAWDGSRSVGGLVAIQFGDTVTVPWASTLRSERRRCPNNLIYWEALRWAHAREASGFDFGRSPVGSGTHRFKLGWGAVEQPLHWSRFGAGGEVRAAVLSGDHSALQSLSRLWTRMPVPLANFVGARLRRYFAN